MASDQRFAGFPPNALSFFADLAENMSKEWMQANKPRYETEVLGPFGALVEALSEELMKRNIPLRGSAKSSIFRINRDVRFSRDKSPYKTNAGAAMTRDGVKHGAGVLYIHLDPQGCFTACGFYSPEPEQLSALREAIRDDPEAFAEVAAALQKAKLPLSEEETLKRLPRGFEDCAGTPVEAAVKLKSLIVRRPLPPSALGDRKLVDRIADFAVASRPLLDFGWKALA